MASVLRTRTTSEPRGFLKMLVDDGSDRILGFTAFGAEASEIMSAVQVRGAGCNGWSIVLYVLRDAIFTHPTAAEGLNVLLAGTPEHSSSTS